MKSILSFLLLFSSISLLGQGIVVDTTTYTVPQLVSTILMQNSCANETNFQYSSALSIGAFTNTNPEFPIQEGIIIRNGIAKYTEGPYTGQNESTQINSNNDADLQAISNSSGQTTQITDVAYLQFDFTPVSTNFSFDFLFGSNEYGEFQCGFSDVFGFFLTNLNTGETVNLALVPGTSTPVSVINIRDNTYNISCASQNASFFGRYNVGDPTNAAINMRGETVLMTAYSEVIPNTPYRIKMAIGDYNDSDYDSAVFIAGGNFTTSTNLGDDQPVCDGQSILLDAGLGTDFNYVWTFNGEEIPNETGATLTADQPGHYTMTATLPNTTCVITDEITLFPLEHTGPFDVILCSTGASQYNYNLTVNNPGAWELDPETYSFIYYATLENATNNGPSIPESQWSAYPSPGNQTIYIKIVNDVTGAICDVPIPFDLVLNPEVVAISPGTINLCNTDTGIIVTNLNLLRSTILGGLTPSQYHLWFYTSEQDAINNTNPITNPSGFITNMAQSPQTIWVRIQDVTNPLCFDITSFVFVVNPIPPVDELDNVIACEEYTLPPLTHGNYFTEPDGGGDMLNPGDVIEESGVYYIFNSPPEYNGCSNESFFAINLVKDFVLDPNSCGVFVVPSLLAGEFYTLPNGQGDLIPAGTVYETEATIYYYAEIDDEFCREEPLEIIIHPIPPVGTPEDVITCTEYVLPTMENVDYYIELTNGSTLFPGFTIIESNEFIAVADDGTCTNQHFFTVDIIDTSFFDDAVQACGSFTLPEINVGNYFTEPEGQGSIIPPGTVITASQAIYYYAETTTVPNCTSELSLEIIIHEIPPVDSMSNVLACGSYELPPLTHGVYRSGSNGSGSVFQPGHIITSSRTVYIYATNGNCSNQTSFQVQIRPFPPVENFNDVFECSTSFQLPSLTHGTYYTEPGGPAGGGSIVPGGTVITETQTFYIYNQWDDFPECFSENVFQVNINHVSVGQFSNITACDSYTLPPLSVGNYFTESGGEGTLLEEGFVLTENQTIYVYAEVGDRLLCTDEAEFTVTISTTPELDDFENIERCHSYILPPLALGSYYTGTGGSGTLLAAGQSITQTQTIYVYAPATGNPSCYDEKSFLVTIHPLKDLVLENGILCTDWATGEILNSYTFHTGLNPSVFTVDWYLNNVYKGSGTSFTANELGTYEIIITKNTPDIGDDCGYNPATVLVSASSVADAEAIAVDDFSDRVNIVVNILNGLGEYEYQLNNGLFQTDPIFYNVPSGQHTVTIRDVKGNCGSISLIVHVLKYPKFFTPNGDGDNDTWHIWDLFYQPEAVINIFDRYGKFIKQLRPMEPGWDGTYNGQALPSTDYWFQVFYISNGEPREFRAHFSMKR